MALYIIRVELHAAGEPDYAVLHTAMESKGFSRFIKDGGGTLWKLPPAEYSLVHTATLQAVLEAAKQAATVTKRKFAVVVTEALNASWDGLSRK